MNDDIDGDDAMKKLDDLTDKMFGVPKEDIEYEPSEEEPETDE